MEIPKGMESKFDNKKEDILSKIDLDKVTSPHDRLLLKLLSYGVTFEQAFNIKAPMVLAQAYPWCKPLENYIVDYVSHDRGRIWPEYFLCTNPRDKESQQQSVKACVRALRIVLIPQGITLPMLRYLGDVKNTPNHRTRKIKDKDPADQLLSLLRGRITGDEYDKLVNKVKAIQQEEPKADNNARQTHLKQTSKDDNEYEPTTAQPQQNWLIALNGMETLGVIVASRPLIFCSVGFSFGILVSRQAIYILISLHLGILENHIFVVLESLFLENKKEPLWVALNLFSCYGM